MWTQDKLTGQNNKRLDYYDHVESRNASLLQNLVLSSRLNLKDLLQSNKTRTILFPVESSSKFFFKII